MSLAPPAGESCPGCGQIDGVEQTSSTPRALAWRCSTCTTSWAVSVVGPRPPDGDRAGNLAEELGRVKAVLGRVVALADDADQLTDSELRDQLIALAERAARATAAR